MSDDALSALEAWANAHDGEYPCTSRRINEVVRVILRLEKEKAELLHVVRLALSELRGDRLDGSWMETVDRLESAIRKFDQPAARIDTSNE